MPSGQSECESTVLNTNVLRLQLSMPENSNYSRGRGVLPLKQIIERVEIHVTHPTAGIIQLVEDGGLRVFKNRKRNTS